jgi:hypothetical protein
MATGRSVCLRSVCHRKPKPGSRSVGRHGCTVAKEVAKPIEEIAAGLSCRLRDMAEPEEAVDQPCMRNVLHLDSHITLLLNEGVALVAQWVMLGGRKQGRR